MQSIRLLATAAALALPALSQVNAFVFYPQDPERQTITCTSFVGRPDMSNRAEATLLKTERYKQQIAEALLAGIMRYQNSLKKGSARAE